MGSSFKLKDDKREDVKDKKFTAEDLISYITEGKAHESSWSTFLLQF